MACLALGTTHGISVMTTITPFCSLKATVLKPTAQQWQFAHISPHPYMVWSPSVPQELFLLVPVKLSITAAILESLRNVSPRFT